METLQLAETLTPEEAETLSRLLHNERARIAVVYEHKSFAVREFIRDTLKISPERVYNISKWEQLKGTHFKFAFMLPWGSGSHSERYAIMDGLKERGTKILTPIL